MASSLSPEQYGGHQSQSSPEGTGIGAQEMNTAAPLNVGFFKSLADKRATRDTNPPKRRGPKPDSKPALTRRQELNRQAQRTHRERKEHYIKALEDEVLRLKELYSTISQDKNKLAEENKQLREALAQHGIPYLGGGQDDLSSNPSYSHLSGTSPGNSYATASHTTFSPSTAPSVVSSGYASTLQPMTGDQMRGMAHSSNGKGVDIDQAGIDFVLALEKPCMQHMPFLLESAADADGGPCGHALMASCPSAPFANLTTDTPFGNTYTHDQGDGARPGQGTWELSKAGLAALLDLSKKLDLDGEITPVMAWGMVLGNPRFAELRPEDLHKLAEDLGRKVRCYGFGAVLEEFELRDAFESILPCEPETMVF
ncbi:bZIP transcription factor [Hirsutella rhossiliensis]|uniref:BZIP transcription factor domain-containing protein n=1 Tax=Hirsutella rhossiliensis TaxID=111463 RepID=A0A9P8MMU9_9HYPO|nr:bZIP transcription factor domain-containing protein [Hirsutella rhossiliensis]KAH0957299.1 bZIP transcription factor domain-containing protein [Hirsutella rhossiliensis]